jgi:ketosteroid isomerase-like protein
MTAAGLEPDAAELFARAACVGVLTAYADAIDGGRAASVVELFTEDAVFEAGPRVLQGRAQLAPAFAAREADTARRTRHLVLNPSCVASGEEAMDVRSTLVLFVFGAEPIADAAPRALVQCEDRMARGPDRRWRIARRRMQLLAGQP